MKDIIKNYIKYLPIFLIINCISAQTIPDANFESAIRTLYPSLISTDSNVLLPAAATYNQVLDFSGWGNATKSDGSASPYAMQPKLTNIDGIGFFSQLKGLDVSNQQLSSLPSTSNTLLFIKATNNQIISLPPNLPTTLEYLRLSQNNLTSLPSLPSGLKALKCDNNQLIQLPSLPNNLSYLDVSYNPSLACLPIIPNNLAINSLPTSSLAAYNFSSNPTRRVDFSNTSIRCIPNFYANAWLYDVTLPTAPGACSEVPTLKSSIVGSSQSENNGSVSIAATLPSPNSVIEYKINNGNYQDSNLFNSLAPGNYVIYARRKSESNSCLNPESSIIVTIPIRTSNQIYVSPLGNDNTGNGSNINPYKTISKALSNTFSGSGDSIILAPGIYIENSILTIPDAVNLIGENSQTTFIRVNHFYNPFDYPTTFDTDSLWRHYDTNFNYFTIQLKGGNHTIKGFSIDGQNKKCLGAIHGSFIPHSVFDDLNIQNFRFSAMVLLFADNTTIQNCYIKNSTYGNYREDKACIFIDGENILIKKNTIILDENIGGYGIKNYVPATVQFFQQPDLLREKDFFLNITLEDNTILVNEKGFWNQMQAPGFTFENFATCKNCIIRNNILNNVLSLVDNGKHSNGYFYDGPRYNISNNTFNLYDGSYTVESMAPNIEFHHNYVFGGGGLNSFAGGGINDYYRGLNYHHNVFYYQRGIYSLSSWTSPPRDFKFNNNTIIDYRGNSISLGNNAFNKNMEVKNNIFANLDTTIPTPTNNLNQIDNSNSVISNNLFFNIAPYGTNSIVTNPQILGAGLKPFTYFRLKKGSPAIDAGLIIPGTTDGYKGKAPDLGAYESVYGSLNNSSSGSLGIGTIKPESSAAIDIFSNSQGVLVPRLPLSNIQNMPSPAEGLLVVCSDCSPLVFYYCDGSNWQKQQGGITLGTINSLFNSSTPSVFFGTKIPNKSSIFELSDPVRGLLLPRVQSLDAILNPTEGLLVYLKDSINKGIYFYDGKIWQIAIKGLPAFAINSTPSNFIGGNLGLNTSAPNPSSLFEINSDNKGLLLPRLGKVQMESIKSPAAGLLVYCYDCPVKGYYYNNGFNWQSSTITNPSTPLNVLATPSGSSVQVSYSPPITNGGSPVTLYSIKSIPGDKVITTTSMSANFSNLELGLSYVFLVTASNVHGSSITAASNPVIIGVPEPPTNVFALRGVNSGTADVYFIPPTNTGGEPITNYTITVMPNNISYTTQSSPYSVSGLENNKTYTFTIKANNINGSSLPALTNAITAGTTLVVAPKMLDNIIVAPVVAYSLRKLKSSYNGPAIKIRRNSDNALLDVGFDTLGNLNEGLIANFCGTSVGSVAVWYDQSGNNKDLSAPTTNNQPDIYNGSQTITLLDTPVLYFNGNSKRLKTSQAILNNSNEVTILTAAYAGYYATFIQHGNGSGGSHFYSRREFANYGFSLNGNNLQESIYSNGTTAAELRLITSRNSVTDNRRNLRVNGNNSATINSSLSTNFTNDILTVGEGFTGHVGEHIEFNQYIPLSVVDVLENSQASYFNINQPCLSNSVLPSTPTTVYASSQSNTSASVSFNISTNSGSRPINYYEVISTPGNIRATGTASPIVVSGLATGTNYNFAVKAVNYCDESSLPAVSNNIVLGQKDAPFNVSATKGISEGSAVITFTAPIYTNNQTITGYTVTSAPDNLQFSGSSSPITITGLSDLKKYTFTVVAHTATTTSMPSLVSNSIYTHTQILNDLPVPKAAYSLRKLINTYNGPALNVRRNDNSTQDIGFLSNGELDENSLLAFVGSGNGFVTIWYDQSGNAKHGIISNGTDQPLIVANGIVCKHQSQPAIRFYSSDKIYVPALTNIKAVHSIFSMGDNNSGGTNVTDLNFGVLLAQSYTSNFGGGGLEHDWQSNLSNRLRWYGTFYETATLFVNGTDKTNVANNYGPNVREYKSLIANVNYNINASFSLESIRTSGSNYSNLSTFLFFGQNLSSTDREKLNKRQSACFELGF